MVSISSTQYLEKMVENYGFGYSLFSQISLEQMEKLQEINPDLKIYLENLFSGKINDPEAIQILEEKFIDYLWIHKPTIYEMNIEYSKIETLIEATASHRLCCERSAQRADRQSGNETARSETDELLKFVRKKAGSLLDKMRKGDVLHVKSKLSTDSERGARSELSFSKLSRPQAECFIIYSGPNLNFSLQNVYLRYQKDKDTTPTEIITPIRYMDILGSTPVNYWESVKIPGLSFEFNLSLVQDKISWKKVEIKTQNYLVGEFKYKKRNSYLMIPLDERTIRHLTSAQKLSVILQLSNRTIFQERIDD